MLYLYYQFTDTYGRVLAEGGELSLNSLESQCPPAKRAQIVAENAASYNARINVLLTRSTRKNQLARGLAHHFSKVVRKLGNQAVLLAFHHHPNDRLCARWP